MRAGILAIGSEKGKLIMADNGGELAAEIAIGTIAGLLRSIKGAKKKAKFRLIFLPLNQLIARAYRTDAEFKAEWK